MCQTGVKLTRFGGSILVSSGSERDASADMKNVSFPADGMPAVRDIFAQRRISPLFVRSVPRIHFSGQQEGVSPEEDIRWDCSLTNDDSRIKWRAILTRPTYFPQSTCTSEKFEATRIEVPPLLSSQGPAS